MPIIIAGPVWSNIKDADQSTLKKIDDALAFETPGIWYNERLRNLVKNGIWDGKKHFFSVKKNCFLTGLLKKVEEISGATVDDRRFPLGIDRETISKKPYTLNGITPSEKQDQSIRGAVRKGRGRIAVATNGGKSEIIIGISQLLGLKSLWLVCRKDLLYQCAERYKLRTGKEAGIIGDGKRSIGEIMTVGSVQTLSKALEADPLCLREFDVLFCDEAAHLQADTWQQIALSCPAPFRFALSGTFPDDDIKLHRVMAVTDVDVIHEVKNTELIDSGWSAKPTIHIQPLDYKDNSMPYKMAYDRMIRFNKDLVSVVASEAERWASEGKQILIIVDRTMQGVKIDRELTGRKLKSVFLHGQLDGEYRKKTLDKFKKSKIPIIIASSILDEGVDVPAIEVLILAAGGKAQGRQLQRVGRGLRKKSGENRVDIVDYIFMGNQYLMDHSLGRVDLYKKEGFEVVWRDPIPMGTE